MHTSGASGGFNVVLNAVDVGPCVWQYRFTVPVGCTGIDFYAQIQYGTGKVSVGQLTLINETTNGLLI